MAVIICRQKMRVDHAEGKLTIFPSAAPQSLPDGLIDHPHIQGGIASGWIDVVRVPQEQETPASETTAVKQASSQNKKGSK
jgi:hypothetical protein